MKSYESSTTTLRAILSHPSLQRDKIEETMDAMFSATEDAKDIDETIRLAGDMGNQTVDEGELEEELKALVQEAEREKAEAADTLRVEQQQKEREAADVAREEPFSADNDDWQHIKRTEEHSRALDELATGKEASIV